MANFDFNSLLSNPAFQFGATLLGSARQPNSIGNAYASLEKMQALKQAQQTQLADIEDRKQQRAIADQRSMIAQGQLDRQNSISERMADAELRKQGMQDAFMKQLQSSGIFGGGAPQQQPQPQPQPMQPDMPQPQQMAPPQAQGGGIDPAILDSLAQVESSGNPRAVNPQSGAQGMYQFMPATTKMLQQKDPTFDPFDPVKARAAASQYLQTLTQQNGGSLERALAAYGGFKTKDPTPYIQKVLRGAKMMPTSAPQQAPQNAAGSPIPIGGGMANSGLELARLGVGAGVTGMPGATQIMELAKMMAPQNVPAGSYQRLPNGEMQYIQDPLATARVAQDQQRIGFDSQRLDLERQRAAADTATRGAALENKQFAENKAQADALAELRGMSGSMEQLHKTAGDLLKHPGLSANTGWSGAVGIPRIPNTEGKNASVILQNLKSQMVVGVLQDLKKSSANGSSGFGALSDKEGKILETLRANLDTAQSEPSMRKAIKDLQDFAARSQQNFRTRYEQTYGTQQDKPKLPSGWSVQEAK